MINWNYSILDYCAITVASQCALNICMYVPLSLLGYLLENYLQFFKKNFATASDLKSGTRHGLFKHLKFAFGPRVRYIPNFHNVAKSYKKTYTTKSEFVAKMLVFWQQIRILLCRFF